ncbi:MAG TPA: rhodanese-like domain-containing protein [Bacteroidia bacterium]|jgi:glyoxylase-like metal-dependent hydrolase (beta-lactamase superfamily II)/rhodanese-related sulfurtransferase|nr:rhodanese-like domain-containing protein [Bacteroidia bacterium]
MYIEQLYTNCLAEAAYWIESEGEAIVIDPIRETEPYLKKAQERGVKIKYVFETHFHADFVSGHIDLAKKTGATIVYGPGAETKYAIHSAHDGEIFSIGKVKVKVLHTPGHTPESTCYLLLDENGKETAVFTGDTLFVGDVGRPDLLDGKMSKEELAGMMFESLKNKLKPLADNVTVYPAHGPGSSCGKNIGKETWSTIGEQKQSNYAMRITNKNEFIKAVTDGLSAPPQYFFKDAMINKGGYESIDSVMDRNVKALDIQDVKNKAETGALILDTRTAEEFSKGFIPGSLFIGLDGTYAVWVGTLVDITTPLIVVANPGKEKEAILRLARVGYENVLGYVNGSVDAWKNAGMPLDTLTNVDPEFFADDVKNHKSNTTVLDVRRPGEWNNGHVKNAEHLCLTAFVSDANLSKLNKETPYYLHCQSGYRSVIAASILKQKGFTKLTNVKGGWSKISKLDLPLEMPVLV